MSRPAPSAVLPRIAAAHRRRPAEGDEAAHARGFALLVTIVLVAFLVLILVGLASFTRVETQVATNSQSTAQARQNALMALNLALGQLQRHAGPDQRVTARADVDIPASVTVTATTPTTTALSAIDTHWRDRRNRQWTGVWLNSNSDPADYDADAPADFNPVPDLQAWLVSGNENAPDTVTPDTVVTGLSENSTALDRILDTNGRPHRLLVKASAGVAAADDLERAVTAPEIVLRAEAPGVPTDPADPSQPPVVGHYAWWVGDEGVKARANLVDGHATAPSGETNEERLAREAARRQSAQRPAIEAMTSDGTDGLAALYPANDPELLNILSADQLRYLNAAATFPAELKTRYHDLSVTSRGVLADVKNGGLKADLTYLFGQRNLADFRTALRAHFGTNDIAPLNPDESNPASLANVLINPVAALRATKPTTTPDGGNYASEPQFERTATWEQLWSFANQGASFNSGGQAAPRSQTGTRHGLYPLVIQTKMFYRLRIEGGEAVADPDGTMVNRTGTIYVDALPLIVLANPYAVPLAAADYQVRITGSNPALVFGQIDPASASPPSPAAFTSPFTSYTPTWAGNITFVLSTQGLAAGEAQIFTIDPDQTVNTTIDGEDRILLNRQGGNSTANMDNRRVYMKNEFNPSPALTYRVLSQASPYPPITIPADKNHVALRLGQSALITILYQGLIPGDPQGYLKLLQYTTAQNLSNDAEFGGQTAMFVVDPMSDGIRQGGGVNSVINQPPTTDRRAAIPGTSSVFFSHQQAPFLQVNYRTMQVTWAGNDSITNTSHPLEWARRFTKNGSTGLPGTTPNPWFAANLLRASGSITTVRWGIVNIGEGNEQTLPPNSIGGNAALYAGHVSHTLGFNNHLYDIPRPGQTLSSLGQLQHFNTTGYHPLTATPSRFTSMSSWQTNYPFSNSYPQPRVPRDKLFNYSNVAPVPMGYHFDGSSIWNDVIWDRFMFSTYPQTGDHSFDPDSPDYAALVNSRYRPFRDTSVVRLDDETAFRGDGNPATAANTRAAAANLLVEGSFNINSTSIEAWKAVFSSLKNVSIGTESAPSAPFTRTFAPATGSTDAASGDSHNSWTGFRDLSPADIQSLAEEMVIQIRKRGPFTSLADFVNRRLVAASSDTLGLGLSGALQAALDKAVNHPSRLAAAFNVKSSVSSNNQTLAARSAAIAEAGYILPAALAGFPGYVLQGDVLSALGSSISARSDTFTIRTYGDSVNPATGDVTGRAWCEAVVQRLPDYVDSTLATAMPAAGSDAEKFGRRFQIVSFRWLSPEDI